MNLKNKETPIDNTVECIEALAKIVKDNDLGKIKISTEDIDIVIEGKRSAPAANIIPPVMPAVGVPAAPAADVAAPAAAESAAVSGNIITSPIIGTFYSSPSPDKAPFVKVGDTINKGDVVCIIESMKIMNE
ncbi:MAG: acetyl-CoA carboxylase biotin carboxyl carrier protein, partial [Oscillospiraceae bacterium]